MRTPRKIYKDLKEPNRQQFWAISISFFIILIAFWIGITFQFVALGDSNEELHKLEHAQILNILNPIKDTFLCTEDSVLLSMIILKDEDNKDSVINKSTELFYSHPERIYSWADTCLSLSKNIKYFFEKEDYIKISQNDFLVTVALPVMKQIHNGVPSEDFEVLKWRYVLENSNHIDPLNNIGFLCYVDSFKKDLNDYYEWHTKYCKLSLSSEAIEVLKKIKYQYFIREDADSFNSLIQPSEEILKIKQSIIIYKYIVSPLIDNYYIIQQNIKPINNSKVTFFPYKRKDLLTLLRQIKMIRFSSDFALSLFSLVLFTIIGALIWYLVLVFTVRKEDEKDENNNAANRKLKSINREIEKEKEFISNMWKLNNE